MSGILSLGLIRHASHTHTHYLLKVIEVGQAHFSETVNTLLYKKKNAFGSTMIFISTDFAVFGVVLVSLLMCFFLFAEELHVCQQCGCAEAYG